MLYNDYIYVQMQKRYVMNVEKFIEKNAPKNRIALLVILDLILITLSGFLALYIRFDFRFSRMDMTYVRYELRYLPVSLVLTIVLFVLFKLYRSVWRFASTTELLNVIGACSVSLVLQIVIMACLKMRMPVSYYLMKYVILITGIGSLRFAYRSDKFLSNWNAPSVYFSDKYSFSHCQNLRTRITAIHPSSKI